MITIDYIGRRGRGVKKSLKSDYAILEQHHKRYSTKSTH